MHLAKIAGGVFAALLLLLVLVLGWGILVHHREATSESPLAAPPAEAEGEVHPSFLHGRVTTMDGDVFEGRLRWGGGEEAFWNDYFNGFKDENRWAVHVPAEHLLERVPIEVFGLHVGYRETEIPLGRPFMMRFGDIVRVDAHGGDEGADSRAGGRFDPDVRVTVKSGRVFALDRFSFGDFDDGVRVWDPRRGVVDLGPREIRSIELLPAGVGAAAPDSSAAGTAPSAAPPVAPDPTAAEPAVAAAAAEGSPAGGRPAPDSPAEPGVVPAAPPVARLHGTVRTADGDFTGLLQWDRAQSLGHDELHGRTDDGELSLRFDTLRSIARESADSSRVTLLDGREFVLSGTHEVGEGNRGVYVDDLRYGRVLVSWDAFRRVDLHAGTSGPAYGDFPPGQPLAGSVTTRSGARFTGRLVFDLDESESTETLDAPSRGVDYTIPFGLVSAIVPAGRGASAATARVVLHSGEELRLEAAGDLGGNNAGLLVFVDDGAQPEYVRWTAVERIDLDRPPATYPPIAGPEERGKEERGD